jgi:hypothetical protein
VKMMQIARDGGGGSSSSSPPHLKTSKFKL